MDENLAASGLLVVAIDLRRAVLVIPRAAVKIQQHRKWPIALRLVNARHQSTRWIAAKLDIPDFDLVMLPWIVRGCHVDSSLRLAFSLSYALSYRETSIFVKTKASI